MSSLVIRCRRSRLSSAQSNADGNIVHTRGDKTFQINQVSQGNRLSHLPCRETRTDFLERRVSVQPARLPGRISRQNLRWDRVANTQQTDEPQAALHRVEHDGVVPVLAYGELAFDTGEGQRDLLRAETE